MTLKNLVYYPIIKQETGNKTDIEIAIGLLNDEYYSCYRVPLKTSTVRYLVAQKQEGLIDTYVKLLLMYANDNFFPFMCGNGIDLKAVDQLEKMRLVQRSAKHPKIFVQVFSTPQDYCEPFPDFPFVCGAKNMTAQDIYKAIFKVRHYVEKD